MSAQDLTFTRLWAIGKPDLWIGGTDMTSEGQMSVVIGATCRVHSKLDDSIRGCPVIRC